MGLKLPSLFLTWLDSRRVYFLLLGLLVFQVAVVWWRTPYLPAASTGDEVWFSESGYYLLNEGSLRKPMFTDGMGSAVHDMYPPMIAIGQAACFALFGVNAFGMMALSSLAFTATVILFYLNLRRRVPCNFALLATCALLGASMFERHMLSVRPETLIAPLFLAFLYVWSSPTRDHTPGRIGLFAGVFAALACICYYPQSPYVLLGILFLTFPLSRNELKSFGWFLAGSGLVLSGWATWIGIHWDFFYAQMIEIGRKYYTGSPLASALNSNAQQVEHASYLKRLISNIAWIEFGLLTCLTVFVSFKNFRGTDKFLLRIALAGLAGLVPLVIVPYPQPILLVHGAVLGLFILAISWRPLSISVRNAVIPATLLVLVVIASLKTVLMLSVVEVEKTARSYAPIERQIAALVSKPGKVGFTQRAWLALRKSRGPDDLHFMVDYLASPQETDRRSLVLRDAKYLPEFSYFVVEHAQLEQLQAAYPLLRTAIESGKFVELARITAPKLDYSITKSAPYDLLVLGRKPSQ